MKNTLNDSTRNFLAGTAIILAGCLWGCMGLYVRFLNRIGFSSLEICEVRSIFTALMLTLGLLIFRRDLLKIRVKDIWCFAGTGILSILFFNFCYFKSIEESPLSLSVIMLYTAPIFVMLMSAVLFKEKITGMKIVSLAVAFGGCVMVSISGGSGGSLSLRGILLGLGSGFGYALYSIFSRYALNRGYKTFTLTAWTFIISALGGIFLVNPQSLFSKLLPLAQSGGFLGVQWGNFFFCIFYSIAATVLPYLFYTAGLSRIENSKASVMAFSEPLTATLIGIFVYREIPGIMTVIGIVLILGALVLLNLKQMEKSE